VDETVPDIREVVLNLVYERIKRNDLTDTSGELPKLGTAQRKRDDI
jgi:hypothetical protein